MTIINLNSEKLDKPKTYCEAVASMDKSNVHRIYHDTAYGFPIRDDNELFGRLILEINQAGLSWTTILNKQENFRKAYHKFDVKKVSAYVEKTGTDCSMMPVLSATGSRLMQQSIMPKS